MTKALDTLVDDDHVYESDAPTDHLLAGGLISHVSAQEAAFVGETFARLDGISQDRWRGAGHQLGAFALKRLAADTIDEYVTVVLDESQLMSDVMKIQNSETRHDYSQRETFNTWMDQLARTSFICDSVSDFVRDYNEGNVSIEPTYRNYVQLSRYALREFGIFVPMTPARVYTAVAHRAVTKSFEKARQPGFWSSQFRKSA